jgi:hypothetical protein
MAPELHACFKLPTLQTLFGVRDGRCPPCLSMEHPCAVYSALVQN